MLVVEHCIGRPHHLSCYLCCLCFVCHHFSLSATILPVLSDCQIINWNIPSLPATQMQIVGTPRSSASCSSHWSMSPAIDRSVIAEKRWMENVNEKSNSHLPFLLSEPLRVFARRAQVCLNSCELSQCSCHIFFCLQYPFERDPPSHCSKLLEEGSPHPPD